MTRHFLADRTSLPVFVWSTNYAGVLEAVLTTVTFAWFASSAVNHGGGVAA